MAKFENSLALDLFVRGPHFGQYIREYAFEQALVRNNVLKWGRPSGSPIPNEQVAPYVSVIGPAVAEGYNDAFQSKEWYRAMKKIEFDYLRMNGVLSVLLSDKQGNDDPSYVGISTNAKYSKSYMTLGGTQTHLVEFNVLGEKSLAKLFGEYMKKHFPNEMVSKPKAEGDGGTYGLGTKGHNGGSVGDLFNDLIALGGITSGGR